MVQREVSLVCVLAWACWSTGVSLAVVSLTFPHMHVAAVVVLLSCAGGVLHIRSSIDNLERREREVFELGRDSVRPLR